MHGYASTTVKTLTMRAKNLGASEVGFRLTAAIASVRTWRTSPNKCWAMVCIVRDNKKSGNTDKLTTSSLPATEPCYLHTRAFIYNVIVKNLRIEDKWVSRGLTSHSTLYRSFQGQDQRLNNLSRMHAKTTHRANLHENTKIFPPVTNAGKPNQTRYETKLQNKDPNLANNTFKQTLLSRALQHAGTKCTENIATRNKTHPQSPQWA